MNQAAANVLGSRTIATMVEAGYDVFSQISKLREDNQKLYVFGHFEYYDSSVLYQPPSGPTNVRLWQQVSTTSSPTNRL